MQIECFNDLPLSKEVLRGIDRLGYSSPSPIQAQTIMPLLEGRDVIGQAQTGTGKTAAFGIPMVERIDPEDRRVQGLVLAPTRELAVQTADHIRRISRYTKLRVLPIYGGESINKQINELKKGAHIVVGTPGRIIDHLQRRTLNLSGVTCVVLDEADRMLDMGFIKDIERILSRVPKNKQTSLFSATIDQSVLNVCNRFMKEPERILVSRDEIALPQISQYYMVVDPKRKFEALTGVLDEQGVERAILFCRTRRGTGKVARSLRAKGYDAEPIHGGLTQPQRDAVMESFRRGKLKILVATDVAARGLDIVGVTHIINYDVPNEAAVYFHRIGRTARMEADGTAITLVSLEEMGDLRQIKALTKTKIQELKSEYALQDVSPRAYNAVCHDCGSECEVPFKPTEGRPVYCRDCFQMHRPARY
jgi:ATP-dependent RNA helicase DeaD